MLVNVSYNGVSFIWYSCVGMCNDGICVDPLAPVLITINGQTRHPLL